MTVEHRTMTIEDLRMVLGWATEEGWNPGADDAEAFLAADPDGFFLAVEDGDPVAAISVVNHSQSFAFLGLYLCRPSHRGRGISYALWQHAIAHAGERTIGLDGVPDQQANYALSGFLRAGNTSRYSGAVAPVTDAGVRPATEADGPALVALEAEASGWNKPDYLTAWFRSTEGRATFVTERGGVIDGLATVRRCRQGAKIGPLVASDEDSARRLLSHAAAWAGADLVIDVPSTSARLDALVRSLELTPSFDTARMYRGPYALPRSELFAVGTLELG